MVGNRLRETLSEHGFVLVSIPQQGVSVILRELMLCTRLGSMSLTFSLGHSNLT